MVSITMILAGLLVAAIAALVVGELRQRKQQTVALSLAFDRGYRSSMIMREEWWPRGATFSYY